MKARERFAIDDKWLEIDVDEIVIDIIFVKCFKE